MRGDETEPANTQNVTLDRGSNDTTFAAIAGEDAAKNVPIDLELVVEPLQGWENLLMRNFNCSILTIITEVVTTDETFMFDSCRILIAFSHKTRRILGRKSAPASREGLRRG